MRIAAASPPSLFDVYTILQISLAAGVATKRAGFRRRYASILRILMPALRAGDAAAMRRFSLIRPPSELPILPMAAAAIASARRRRVTCTRSRYLGRGVLDGFIGTY